MKNKITKPSAKIATLQLSAYGGMVHVTHYIEGNGVGKGYSYFLESINSDTLVLFNERYYDLEEIKITGVRHVYIKQKEQ